jgi:undecaprenyl-diphosphatase
MSWWQALVLGVVQGLTEFFPISSSGHLALVPWLFGWNELDDVASNTAFDAALHLGTLAAVVFAVRKELVVLVTAGVRYPFVPRELRRTQPEGRLAWLFLVTAVPAAVVGALFDEFISDALGGPLAVAVSLIAFGMVLWVADRSTGVKTSKDLSGKDAWLIGVAQVLALNPGTSRSGITISAMRVLGYERAAAVRMSFIMGVPIIGGAGTFKLVSLLADGVPAGLGQALIIGISSAAVTGWLAINALQRLAARRNFNVFVVYRLALGAAVIALIVSGLR